MKKIHINGKTLINVDGVDLMSFEEIIQRLNNIPIPTILFSGNKETTPIKIPNIESFKYLEIEFQCNNVISLCKIPAKNGRFSVLTEGEAGITTYMGIASAVIIIEDVIENNITKSKISFFKNVFAGAYCGNSLKPADMAGGQWYEIGINKIVGYS